MESGKCFGIKRNILESEKYFGIRDFFGIREIFWNHTISFLLEKYNRDFDQFHQDLNKHNLNLNKYVCNDFCTWNSTSKSLHTIRLSDYLEIDCNIHIIFFFFFSPSYETLPGKLLGVGDYGHDVHLHHSGESDLQCLERDIKQDLELDKCF